MAAPLLLFAPGAGAPSSSPWMKRYQAHLAALGEVRAFDYPYRIEGRKAPDRLPVLISAHEQALAQARAAHSGPVVLIGKSMGSRIGCHVSLTTSVDAIVNLGYPLVSAGKSGKVRDQVLLQLTTPTLFVQGTRDPLCPLAQLSAVLERATAPTELYVVEHGDHSLEVTRTRLEQLGVSQQAVEAEIVARIGEFIRRTTSHCS